MKIEPTSFGPWQQAHRLTHDNVELIVVSEIGPRILSLRVNGGENLLFVDEDGLSRGEWRIYGGHRVWLGPETEASYAPDNAACDVSTEGGVLTIAGPEDPLSHLQKHLRIAAAGPGRFSVTSGLSSNSEMLMPAVVWALTCVRPDARIFFPWGQPGNWEMKKICYWKAWGGTHASTVTSSQWQPGEDLFVIDPTGEEGKCGTSGCEGWLGANFPAAGASFFKRFQYQLGREYVDDGCAIQCYTCANFIEMETLSPQQILLPGERLEHEEIWIAQAGLADLTQPDAIRTLIAG